MIGEVVSDKIVNFFFFCKGWWHIPVSTALGESEEGESPYYKASQSYNYNPNSNTKLKCRHKIVNILVNMYCNLEECV